MPVYRVPDNPLFGYYLGTFVLSFLCLIIGEYSISFAFRCNKEKITHDNSEMTRFQDISIKALMVGNKDAYKACNSIANEAYGKNFFSQIALSASSLWPIFIALGWMHYRFADVDFSTLVPISGAEYILGYVTTFILCFIVSRTLFNKVKKCI